MTKVTGASDDLIELDGDIYEEFNWYAGDSDDDEHRFLAFSDGTVLSVQYDQDGIWRFNSIYKGTLYDKKIDGEAEKDTPDIIHFKDGLKWVVFGKDYAKSNSKAGVK